MNLQDIVRQRHSCRTFNGLHIDKATNARIIEEIAGLSPLFDDVALPAIRLVDNDEAEGRLGTYGFITGARQFLVMASGKTTAEQLQAGFMFESLILKMTEMGLGTCWLGGTFRRGPFTDVFGPLESGKEVSIVSPVGHPTEKRRFSERMMRRIVKADTRRPFDSLFDVIDTTNFVPVDDDARKNLKISRTLPQDSPLRRVLEAVRLAPSSSNSQPWRGKVEISITPDGLKSTAVSFRCVVDNRFSAIDMGIAYCHFLLASRQENLGWELERTENPVELVFRSC